MRLIHRRISLAGQRGLTVVEAIGMTIIIGLLAGLAYPAIYGLRKSGLDQQAIGVAQALNQAQQTFALRVANAETQWEAVTDAQSKYGLISQYVPFSTPNFTDFEPAGYTLAFGSTLNSKVTITRPDGTAIGSY